MKRILSPLSLLVAGMIALSACGSATPTPAAAALSSPPQRSLFTAGDAVKIEGEVTGATVKKAQLMINNQTVAIVDQPSEPGKFVLAVDYPLPPDTNGSVVLQLNGLDENDKVVAPSDLVFISVNPAATATPPPIPTPVPTVPPPATATAVAATEPTTSTTGTEGAPPAASGAASITNKDNEFVNVRTGPGLTFSILGQVRQTQTANVKGKSEDGKWWQIEFAGGEGGLGWIFSDLVQFTGNASAVPVIKVAVPTAAPAAVQPTAAPVVPLAPTAPPAPAAPTSPPAALLPYSQSDSFRPRNDIGDVPLGHNGESNASTWAWNINGAQRAELEITAPGVPDSFDCKQGNLAGISPNSAAGKRLPVNLPTGEFPFQITESGYYVFTLHIVKADGSTTALPRAVIYGCYKKPGR
jgi:uncharacterized protein YraI